MAVLWEHRETQMANVIKLYRWLRFGRQDIENDENLLLLTKDENHQICLFGRDFQFTPNLSSWQECLGCFEL